MDFFLFKYKVYIDLIFFEWFINLFYVIKLVCMILMINKVREFIILLKG